MSKRLLSRVPILLLAAALLAPFLPLLLARGGQVLGNPECDNPAMFYYINAFAGRCWRQGIIPLWNPHIMLGLPFLGEGQAALFHPLSWLFILLPTGVAINWLVALSFLLTGLFFYGYLRALGLGRPAACFGALVWCYSNVLIARLYAGHLTILLELIEMPLILLLWERFRRGGRRLCLVGIAAAYGLLALAAYPQVLYIFSLFFMLYVLLQSALEITSRAEARAAGRKILLLGGFIALGTGIGAIQLLPMEDFAAQSIRQKTAYEFASSFSFEPENLVTVLAPRFYGFTTEAGPDQYWARCNFWEMTVYIGILPLVLALIGLAAAPWRRRVLFATGALVFLILALGGFTPLFPLIYRYVPFFHEFRGPSKNILMTELCLVTLSAFGAQELFKPAGATRRRLLAGLIGGGVLLGFLLALYLYFIPGSAAPGSHWRQLAGSILDGNPDEAPLPFINATARRATIEVLRSAAFLVLTLGVLTLAWRGKGRRALPALIFALALGDLLCVFVPLFKTYDEAITRDPKALVAPLRGTPYPSRLMTDDTMPNRAMLGGYATTSGYSGNTLKRYNDFVNTVLGKSLDVPAVANPICQYQSAFRLFAYDAVLLRPEGLRNGMQVLARTTSTVMIRFPESFPRVFLAAQPRPVASADEALRYALDFSAPLLASPAVEAPAAELPPAAPLGAGESVRITSFTPTRVELEASAAQPRLLVLGEMYEKNWTATVGDRPARVYPANYLFRGVVIPRGPSRVVFEYRPASFRRGACGSLLALAALLAIALRTGLGKNIPLASPVPRLPEPTLAASAGLAGPAPAARRRRRAKRAV